MLDDYCVEVLPYGADREEWLAVRRQGIGGSDCSAVMGMSPRYASPYTVWEDKTGRAPAVDESEAMLWGNLLEPVIREEAARRLGLTFSLPGTLRSLERPWQQANLDGLASDGGIMECKNTSAWLAAHWDGQIPDHAELQCQHNMAVTGADHAWAAGLVGGHRLVIARVDRDDELIELINAEEERLWIDHVLADTPPPEDPSEATRTALIRRFAVEERVIELEDDPAAAMRAVALAEQWKAAGDREKAAKADKAQAENGLRLLMAGANCATIGGQPIAKISGGTWSARKFEENEPPEKVALYRRKVEVVDSKALRAEDPDTWGKYQAQVLRAYPLTTEKGA